MKELSIEEKAKAYDEALERARKFATDLPNGRNDRLYHVWDLESIFPELKESEDDRIRKMLIQQMERWHECALENNVVQDIKDSADAITWLEKQGEQKSYDACDSSMTDNKKFPYGEKRDFGYFEEKPTDKVEPKFHEGDWVIDKQGIVHQISNVIENVTNHTYGYDIVGGGYFNDNTEGVKLWNIQDAKAGDVLADGNLPFIFKKIDTNKYSYAYCGINVDDGFKIESDGELGEWTWMQDIKPATKEQRNLLFQKMHEAGFEWDAEKKELKKPACSEEDEDILNTIINHFKVDIECTDEDDMVRWLKFLKDRVQTKQEWSKEEKKRIDRIIDVLDWAEDKGRISYSDWEDYVTYVRCLRPQPNTKWYKLDDNIQKKIINYFECQREIEPTRKDILNTWIDWLKSLRPQKLNITNKDFEDIIREIKTCIAQCNGFNRKHREEVFNLLDSLRPQTTWKPSDEMLEALYRVTPENVMEKSEDEILLDKLYQGLKYGKVLSEK